MLVVKMHFQEKHSLGLWYLKLIFDRTSEFYWSKTQKCLKLSQIDEDNISQYFSNGWNQQTDVDFFQL